MLIPPKYFLTPKIAQLLQSIEASKQVIDSVDIPIEIATNIRRQSTLRSSLYSARIEGNTLTLNDISAGPSKDQKKVEIFNILKALNQIEDRGFKDLTLKEILNYHSITMANLIDIQNRGLTRQETNAIFNSGGIAIYLPPRPSQVTPLLNKLVTYINSPKEAFIPIKAIIAHYVFEKIHPFMDGNGRVGRLLLQAILKKHAYDMKGLLSLEEYLDNNRSHYYQSLEDSEKDITDYIEFMLEAIATTAAEAKTLVLEKRTVEAADYLLPRRAEILNIIKDQKLVNFDTLHRRFMGVNQRTLRFDIKKLVDAGLVRKLGTTNGVYYEIIETN